MSFTAAKNLKKILFYPRIRLYKQQQSAVARQDNLTNLSLRLNNICTLNIVYGLQIICSSELDMSGSEQNPRGTEQCLKITVFRSEYNSMGSWSNLPPSLVQFATGSLFELLHTEFTYCLYVKAKWVSVVPFYNKI